MGGNRIQDKRQETSRKILGDSRPDPKERGCNHRHRFVQRLRGHFRHYNLGYMLEEGDRRKDPRACTRYFVFQGVPTQGWRRTIVGKKQRSELTKCIGKEED